MENALCWLAPENWNAPEKDSLFSKCANLLLFVPVGCPFCI